MKKAIYNKTFEICLFKIQICYHNFKRWVYSHTAIFTINDKSMKTLRVPNSAHNRPL